MYEGSVDVRGIADLDCFYGDRELAVMDALEDVSSLILIKPFSIECQGELILARSALF